MTTYKHLASTKWFFILVAFAVLYLFWQVIEPFIIVIVTAGIFAIIFTPVDRWLRKYIKYPKFTALIVTLGVLLVVVIPLFFATVLIAQQAAEIVGMSLGENGWLSSFSLDTSPILMAFPIIVQEQILSINFFDVGTNIAEWAFKNLGDVASRGASFSLNVFIFFLSFYYLILDRNRLYKIAQELSPFKDELDSDILKRIIHTVRSVVFGAVIIALVQAILASIGMTIFGVPGALLWGALMIITAQVPMIGPGIVLVPAIAYLIVTGQVGNAIGLSVWGFIVVGLIDNVLSPFLVGSKTQMPVLLILISILGGLRLFGPIGFILGPTILAGVFIVIDIYKTGILEHK